MSGPVTFSIYISAHWNQPVVCNNFCIFHYFFIYDQHDHPYLTQCPYSWQIKKICISQQIYENLLIYWTVLITDGWNLTFKRGKKQWKTYSCALSSTHDNYNKVFECKTNGKFYIKSKMNQMHVWPLRLWIYTTCNYVCILHMVLKDENVRLHILHHNYH
jgi:hypothetical protein